MEDLSEEALTTTFDKLVSEGVIVYGPHESVKVEAEGYPVHNAPTSIICP
jgi:hypothetical protein